jgi:hypothetical protein
MDQKSLKNRLKVVQMDHPNWVIVDVQESTCQETVPLLKPCQMGEAFDTCQTSSHFDMPSNWGVEGATNVAKKAQKRGINATNVAPLPIGTFVPFLPSFLPFFGTFVPRLLAALARTESPRVCIEQGIIALHLEFQ